MGRSKRDHPRHLASKLREIRTKLGFTQEQMAETLRAAKSSTQPGHVSEFEHGLREPSLLVLLRYAELAGVYIDAIVDDRVRLPSKLPSSPKSEGVKRK